MTVSELRRALDSRGALLPAATVAVFETQLWGRWTAPLACLVAALLGVPLAVVRERKAPVLSFVLAAGLMGGYYLISQVALSIGRSGVLPAAFAALAPALVFCAGGCWLVYRRR